MPRISILEIFLNKHWGISGNKHGNKTPIFWEQALGKAIDRPKLAQISRLSGNQNGFCFVVKDCYGRNTGDALTSYESS